MKLIAGILALIVLVLTIQPVLANFKKAEKAQKSTCSSHCCSDDAELPADEEDSDDPCSDFCNPFLKCGGCAASTMEFLNFSLQKPDETCAGYIISTQRVYSQFAPDFWQPPKLA